MFRTTPHRQVALAVALVAFALTGAVAGVAVAQTDVSSSEPATSPTDADTALAAANETNADGNISATVVHEGERLELDSADDQNVTIRTNATAETKLNVVLRENGNYVDVYEATVSAQGTATVSLDLRSVEAGTNVSVTVRHGQRSLTKTAGIVSRSSATFFHEGERLVLRSAADQTVRVETNADPGTEIPIRAKAGGVFLKSQNAVVSENGTATATFDFSDVAPGTEFEVSVRGDPESETTGVVVNESATVHRDATFAVSDPTANFTVHGTVDDPTVTKLDVRVSSSASSFAVNRTVGVGDDGTFAATLDLSSLDSDTEVTVEVGGIPRSIETVVATGPSGEPAAFAFVETPLNLTLGRTDGTILVHADSDQTIRGATNLRPGTELVVTAQREEMNVPDDFAVSERVTVGEDGQFGATLNFTGVEAGTNFTVTVERGLPLAKADGRVVNDSVEIRTATTGESTDGHVDEFGVPGFGVPVALVALLAGLALARRN